MTDNKLVNTQKLRTEQRNPNTKNIDKLDTIDAVTLMHKETERAFTAVSEVLDRVALAVDAITNAFENGGSLYYIGAGTSGRLGVLDASECPPTFGVEPEMVVGIIAGGDGALRKSSEGAEDSFEAGYEEIKGRGLGENDVLVGIAASGRTPYVLGAMTSAKEKGCTTVSVTSNPGGPCDQLADIAISPDTGAEVVTGSTRLKSGTAQKLILNMLSTCAMIKTGRVYENLMINVRPTNDKLKARCASITSEILGVTADEAFEMLRENGFSIKETVEKYKK